MLSLYKKNNTILVMNFFIKYLAAVIIALSFMCSLSCVYSEDQILKSVHQIEVGIVLPLTGPVSPIALSVKMR
jgi:hypothetical protein